MKAGIVAGDRPVGAGSRSSQDPRTPSLSRPAQSGKTPLPLEPRRTRGTPFACEELCDCRWAASADEWAGARPAGVGTLALARDPQPSVHRARQGRPRGGDRHHWGAARVDRLDDLGVVDALESDGGRASPCCWAIPIAGCNAWRVRLERPARAGLSCDPRCSDVTDPRPSLRDDEVSGAGRRGRWRSARPGSSRRCGRGAPLRRSRRTPWPAVTIVRGQRCPSAWNWASVPLATVTRTGPGWLRERTVPPGSTVIEVTSACVGPLVRKLTPAPSAWTLEPNVPCDSVVRCTPTGAAARPSPWATAARPTSAVTPTASSATSRLMTARRRRAP